MVEESWLDQCRENFGYGSERLKYIHLKPEYFRPEVPQWANGDDMDFHFKNLPVVYEHGVVIWGHIIQVNALLFEEGQANCPGEFVYCENPRDRIDIYELSDIASKLFDLKGTDQAHSNLKNISGYLADEMIRVFGLQVPEMISPLHNCRISSSFFERRYLPNYIVSKPIMPLLAYGEYGQVFVTVLPYTFWPKDMVSWWNS